MRLSLALLVLSTGVAGAAPYELSPTGDLVITGDHAARVPVGIKKGTVTSETVRGTPTIVVRGDDEAVVLQLDGGTWKQVVRTKIGGVGLDADYSDDVVALPEGVFSFQTRPGLARCDGKPALLFASGFDGTKFRRLSKLPSGIAESAPVIQATRQTADEAKKAALPLAYHAQFASHEIGAADAGSLGPPSELDDGKTDTAWREELATSAGEGQFFTYVPRVRGAKAQQIRIVTSTLKDANRPHRIGVVAKSGSWHVDLPADAAKDPAGTSYLADLPAPVDGCVTLVLESTFGKPDGATSLGELEVFATGELAGGFEGAFAKEIADGGESVQSATQALANRGAAAVAALEAELGRAKDAAARHRLVAALAGTRDPAAAAVFAHLALDGKLKGEDLDRAILTMRGAGQEQALHDLAAREGLAAEARAHAAEMLNSGIDKERELLIDLAGSGPRMLREAVIENLSRTTAFQLLPVVTTEAKASRAGDVWRAITRRVHAASGERQVALPAMVEALSKATDYERRYRLVDGIAAIGDVAALHALGKQLSAMPDDAQTAAYKHVAARAIATNIRVEATDLLVALAHDGDPGVRMAALSVIAGASGTPSGPWHRDAGADGIDRVIITLLSSDTWPEVRRTAAQVLGDRCARPGPVAALADSIARDPDVGVRGDALEALVRCHAPSAPATIEKLWNDGKAPIELRQRAIGLIVQLGDRAAAGKLVRKFTQWRGEAIESASSLDLAKNAAFAIGAADAPGAADALEAALDDGAFPEIVAAAATALGLLGPACPASAKRKLEELGASDEQQVQMAARRAAAVCGKR